MSIAVRVHGLVRRFGERIVLDGVDLEIRAGEFVALLGRSGSGKSTLLRALAGLDRQTIGSGDLSVPDRVSVVFQDARLLPWKRVFDNITLGLTDRSARSRVDRSLEEVGLAGRGRSWPYELSGGEQQRVALARSLVRDPQLLLADEPFGALDALTRIRMHALLRQLSARHRPAVLLVTHDVDEAIELAQRVLILEAGRITLDVPIVIEPEDLEGRAALRAQLLAHLGVPGAMRSPESLNRAAAATADRPAGYSQSDMSYPTERSA
jgi:sulfonate transport system ATP-binding protein